MDNRDNRGVPPDIRPKLPEQQPMQPRKKPGLTSQAVVIIGAAGVLIAILATWFIVFALGAGKTPAQAVAKNLPEGFTLQEELIQVSLTQVVTAPEPTADDSGETAAAPKAAKGGERSVYFFISNEQLACTLLERKAGGYKVGEIAGHLPLTGDGKPGIWMGTAATSQEYLVFGLLYDGGLSKVEVEGKPAVIIDTGRYRCWYYLGEGSMTINSESVVFK